MENHLLNFKKAGKLLFLLSLLFASSLPAGANKKETKKTLDNISYAKVLQKDITANWYQGDLWINRGNATFGTSQAASGSNASFKTPVYGLMVEIPFIMDQSRTRIYTRETYIKMISYSENNQTKTFVDKAATPIALIYNQNRTNFPSENSNRGYATVLGSNSTNIKARMAFTSDNSIGADKNVNCAYYSFIIMSSQFKELIARGVSTITLTLTVGQINYEKSDETISQDFSYTINLPKSLASTPTIKDFKYGERGALTLTYDNVDKTFNNNDNPYNLVYLNVTTHDYQNAKDKEFKFSLNKGSNVSFASGYTDDSGSSSQSNRWMLNLPRYIDSRWDNRFLANYKDLYPSYWNDAYNNASGSQNDKISAADKALLWYVKRKIYEGSIKATLYNQTYYCASASQLLNNQPEPYTTSATLTLNENAAIAQPSQIQATVHKDATKVTLSWTALNGDSYNNSQPFAIERKTNNGDYSSYATAGYSKSNATYSFDDTSVEEGNSYTYRVSRLPGTDNVNVDLGVTALATIDYTDLKPSNVTATWDGTAGDVQIVFEYNRDNYSEMSPTFDLQRKLLNGTDWESVSFTLEGENGQYTLIDKSVATHSCYDYRIVTRLKGGLSFTSTSVNVTTNYLESSVTDFVASKGIYNDGVALEFKLTQGSPTIYVERRVKGTDTYRQLTQLSNLSASTSHVNHYTDNTCASGFYEYRLRLENWDNELNEGKGGYIVSCTAPQVGFKRSSGIVTGNINYEGGSAVKDVKVVAIPTASGSMGSNAVLMISGNDPEMRLYANASNLDKSGNYIMNVAEKPFSIQLWVGSTYSSDFYGTGFKEYVGVGATTVAIKNSGSRYQIKLYEFVKDGQEKYASSSSNAAKVMAQMSETAQEAMAKVPRQARATDDEYEEQLKNTYHAGDRAFFEKKFATARTDGQLYWDQVTLTYDRNILCCYLNGEFIGADTIPSSQLLSTNSTQKSISLFPQFHNVTEIEDVMGLNKAYEDYLEAKGETYTEGMEIPSDFTTSYLNTLSKRRAGSDEIRFWTKALTADEVAHNYSSYLVGDETGLKIYWKFDERVNSEFYDYSFENDVANGNHGTIDFSGGKGSPFSIDGPTADQLTACGYTDSYGSYKIAGIPYSGSGSSYRIVPMYGTHSFSPKEEILHFDESSHVSNSVKFEDNSSFTVTGQVFYEGTSFPVENANIYIDEKMTTQNGNIVTTDAYGQFSVQVPIGSHYIKIMKSGHTFAYDGRFPASKDSLFVFDRNISLSTPFYDLTKCRVVGRVCGGTVQSGKKLGVNESTNNLGKLSITLKASAKETFALCGNKPDTTLIYHPRQKAIMGANGPVAGTSTHVYKTMMIARPSLKSGEYEINIIPDEVSGEFFIDLIPESFKTTEVIAGEDEKGQDFLISEFQRPGINVSNNAGVKSYISYETGDTISKFDSSTGLTAKKAVVDSITYCGVSQQFIRRNTPVITVSQEGMSSNLFGDTQITYYSGATQAQKTIPFITNNKYLINDMPVFTQGSGYTFDIALKEVYSYKTSGGVTLVDEVPVTDGVLNVSNNLSLDPNVVLAADSITGKAVYHFIGAPASLTIDANNPALSFAKSMNIIATCNDGLTTTSWYPQNSPFKGTLLGGRITGNNFITNGPKETTTVLRDPPGSNSFSSISSGSVKTTYKGSLETNGEGIEANADFVVGTKVSTGWGVIVESVANENRVGVGIVQSSTWTSGSTCEKVTSWDMSYSTSGSPSYVGGQYDVIVGQSTNIIYSEATTVKAYPKNDLPAGIDNTKTVDLGNGYVFAQRQALDVTMDFSTDFVYTVEAIETKVIPDLEKLRNTFILPKGTQVDSMLLGGNAYISTVDANDVNFGKANYYKIVYPATSNLKSIDTINYYNSEIAGWVSVLKENEEDKVNSAAKQTDVKNYSFSGGTSLDYSASFSTTTETTHEHFWEADPHVDTHLMFKLGGVGLEVKGQVTSLNSGHDYNNKTASSDSSYTYHLEDDDAHDFHSVDVYPSLKGWGPVFKMRGGQTSCPYEPSVATKYYNAGKSSLSDGSEQIEMPSITITPGLRTGVPGNSAAIYQLTLSNESGVKADVDYVLTVNESSNPNGANLSIDGEPIGNGRVFTLASGTKYSKTLTITRTNEDIKDYNNIELKLSSTCDGNISSSCLVSANFIASLGDLSIDNSINNAIINLSQIDKTSTLSGAYKGLLPIKVGSYDYNKSELYEIQILYKGSNEPETAWTQLARYMKKPSLDKSGKALQLEAGGFIYYWDVSQIPDRTYNIKAVAMTATGDQGPMSASDVITVIKNTASPQVFGTPQPSNGVLGTGDDISIAYDKEIDKSLIDVLTQNDITVKGVLNAQSVDHNAGLSFDGNGEYAVISSGLNLTNTPYTIEFQAKRLRMNAKEVLLYQQGDESDFEVGYTADNKLYITINGITGTAQEASSETDVKSNFANYRIAYNGSKIWLTLNSKNLVNGMVIGQYNGYTPLFIGNDQALRSPFKGELHNLRIWKKYLSEGSDLSTSLTGREVNLLGYWPMNEATGNTAGDKVRNQNATLFCSWFVDPLGKAVTLDGASYVSVPVAKQLTADYSYSTELWFKGSKPKANSTLMSNGVNDNDSRFNVYLDATGRVNVAAGNDTITAAGNVADNKWHNVVWSVDPNASATLFVDGEAKGYIKGSQLDGLYGSEFTLGAYATYNKNQNTTTYGSYFTGNVDEFRYWDKALDKELIALNYASKLHGDEGGLLSYYPFDTYNSEKTQLVASLKDGVDSSKTATFKGNCSYNDQGMALKAPLPLSSVPFTWALNTDKLVITLPTTTYYRKAYENCNLTVSVNRLFDLYGNRADVRSWNVYVDRKEVRWNDHEINYNITNGKSFTFKTTILNRGGSTKEFALTNLPGWLTASPSSGTLQPQSSKEITFTVAGGINIGRYEQGIFLNDAVSNDDVIYSDVMYLDLKVGAQAPDWTVNAQDYEYSMNIFGTLQINGVPSTDKDDLVGAFDGETCLGVASPQYVEAYNRYYLFMKVYSNKASVGNLKFRIWDAGKDVVYSAKTSQPITFADRMVYGSTESPVVFDTDVEKYQTISLGKGWNWISYNVYNKDLTSVNSILGGLNCANGDVVKLSQTNYFDTYSSNTTPYWTGTLTKNGGFNNTTMYMLKVSYAGSLNVCGTQVDPAGTSIPVKGGEWNYISYLPNCDMTINEALAGYSAQANDVLKSIDGFALYDAQAGWIGDITYMKPGAGYILYRQSSTATQFKYPAASTALAAPARIKENVAATENAHPYSGNMSIVAQISNYEPKKGDVLTAYLGDERVATANVVTTGNQNFYFLTVPGESDTNKSVTFAVENEGVTGAVASSKTTYYYNGIRGNLSKPYLINFGAEQELYVEATPNPFTDKAQITILTNGCKATAVRIYDMDGRLVDMLVPQQEEEGYYTATWHGTTAQGTLVKSGVYLLNILTEQGSKTLKIERK